MKVLVTGGAGFIGSHIVDLLIEKGHDVVVIDDMSKGSIINLNPRAKLFQLDICSSEISNVFEREKLSAVIHQAAKTNVRESINRPYLYEKDNVLGTINLLECCRKFNVKRFIYAGSSSRYGNPEYLPCDENHPVSSSSPYSLSKNVAENYIKLYSQLHNINYTILVYSNAYGPRQNSSNEAGVTSIFINKLLKNESPLIFGNGEQTRDFTFVKDLAKANLIALTNKSAENKTFNISYGNEISVNDLYDKISGLLKKKIKPIYKPAIKGEIRKIFTTSKLIFEKLGWKPQTNLDDGLSETIDYCKNSTL